jgi:hypothetical protein
MFEEDLSLFTDPGGLGDTATVNGHDMYGIFERQFADVKDVEGYYPTFLVSVVDSGEIVKNSTSIFLQDIEYTAISKRPDGTGMSLLILEEI